MPKVWPKWTPQRQKPRQKLAAGETATRTSAGAAEEAEMKTSRRVKLETVEKP